MPDLLSQKKEKRKKNQQQKQLAMHLPHRNFGPLNMLPSLIPELYQEAAVLFFSS